MITNLERDGEIRRFAAHGQAVLGAAGGVSMLKGTFHPGWRWSTDVAPIAGTTSCRVRHLGYVIEGRMGLRLDDGTNLEIGPGDLFDAPPGHDAWVIGQHDCVIIDISPDATRYATGPAQTITAAPDPNIALVQAGYAAFNTGDIPTLMKVMSRDVLQHVPGNSPLAGEYKGIEAVLGYYAMLGELTGGTFRADLLETHSDGRGHVLAVHQISATRNGIKRVTRGSILFAFLGGRATDLLEMHADQAGDDAFFA
jgi:ketosteroid isomerase-like protein